MPYAAATQAREDAPPCPCCGRRNCDCVRKQRTADGPSNDGYERDAAGIADRLALHVPTGPSTDRLSATQRTFFESHLGDLGDVRLHAGPDSAASAARLSARAYTVGSDIYFGRGEHRTDTLGGRRLLAHEVAHVAQQRAPGGPTGRVQRATTLTDCTAAQTPALQAAIPIARTDLGTAIAALTTRPLAQKTIDALWLAFRRSTDATADQVKGVLQNALTYLGNATIECEQPGTFLYDTMCSDADAYVRAAWALLRTGNIHLCMGSFDTNPTQYKAEVLIHEATHRSSNTSDNGYYRSDWSESSQTVGLSPDQRLDNADSFAKFVHLVAHESDATLAAQAGEWRGDRLTITQRPPGAISLAAGALSTTFKVEGWPGGGFKFRWVIAEAYGTAADRRYMVRATSNDAIPFDYGPYTEIYIGRPSRDLLDVRGVTSATLLCRMLNVDGSDHLLTLPLQFVP